MYFSIVAPEELCLRRDTDAFLTNASISLTKEEPFHLPCNTWMDVLSFMHEGDPGDARNDKIVRPIFEAHSRDADPRWRTILLVIFRAGLESIH
jgi:hypothetical protein